MGPREYGNDIAFQEGYRKGMTTGYREGFRDGMFEICSQDDGTFQEGVSKRYTSPEMMVEKQQ